MPTAPIFPYMPGVGFPKGRSVGQWDTTIQAAMSGKETRFANRTQARYKYTLVAKALDSSGANAGLVADSKQILDAFFNATLGGALLFNYWDEDDNTADGVEYGVGDGTSTQFQLGRSVQGWFDYIFAPIISGGAVYVRPGNTSLVAPYSAPVLEDNGALVSSSAYSISQSGLVTFGAAPAAGHALTWSGSYFWPCNFDDDTLDMSKFMGSLWEAKKIAFTTRIF
jgi:hypothetical protein